MCEKPHDNMLDLVRLAFIPKRGSMWTQKTKESLDFPRKMKTLLLPTWGRLREHACATTNVVNGIMRWPLLRWLRPNEDLKKIKGSNRAIGAKKRHDWRASGRHNYGWTREYDLRHPNCSSKKRGRMSLLRLLTVYELTNIIWDLQISQREKSWRCILCDSLDHQSVALA